MNSVDRTYSASAYIVFEKKVLLVFNKKLNLWLCPGGHLLPNEFPHIGVKREVREETGLEIQLFPVDCETDIDGATLLPQPNHLIRYKMWPGHEVINFTYFAKPASTELHPSEKEIAQAKWLSKEELDFMDIPTNTRIYAKKAIEEVKD